ncbi:DUF6068 family protein [Melittangium boletus]|uniref:DUF6068 family protein n=1 Tax=Melittangium boletus TaxID=83453 RepID=UPI003DA31B82
MPLPRALFGAALLFLLPGCTASTASGPSPSGAAQSAKNTDNGWRRARVGDRVTYAFSARQGSAERGTPRTLSGRVTLSVTAVKQPWVWLTLAFQDASGQPLPQARLARELVLPVRAEETHPIEVAPLGEPQAERVSLAQKDWDALRYVKDDRPVDGNLVNRLYAKQPGPLYLTRGLLQAITESAGFRVPGGLTLDLVDAAEGKDGAGEVPALERPLGPGTWYDRRVDLEPAPTLQRVCFGAERGYLLRTERPIDTQAAPCADLAEAEAEPLEEVLMGLAWEALTAGDWPPPAVQGGTQDTFRVEKQEVPALTVRRTQKEEGAERVYTETVAADPWGPTLSGLAREARFQPLAEGTERVGPGGKSQPEGGSRLVRWGTWLDGAK